MAKRGRFACTLCKTQGKEVEKLDGEEKLREHIATDHLNYAPFRCSSCSNCFASADLCQAHIDDSDGCRAVQAHPVKTAVVEILEETLNKLVSMAVKEPLDEESTPVDRVDGAAMKKKAAREERLHKLQEAFAEQALGGQGKAAMVLPSSQNDVDGDDEVVIAVSARGAPSRGRGPRGGRRAGVGRGRRRGSGMAVSSARPTPPEPATTRRPIRRGADQPRPSPAESAVRRRTRQSSEILLESPDALDVTASPRSTRKRKWSEVEILDDDEEGVDVFDAKAAERGYHAVVVLKRVDEASQPTRGGRCSPVAESSTGGQSGSVDLFKDLCAQLGELTGYGYASDDVSQGSSPRKCARLQSRASAAGRDAPSISTPQKRRPKAWSNLVARRTSVRAAANKGDPLMPSGDGDKTDCRQCGALLPVYMRFGHMMDKHFAEDTMACPYCPFTARLRYEDVEDHVGDAHSDEVVGHVDLREQHWLPMKRLYATCFPGAKLANRPAKLGGNRIIVQTQHSPAVSPVTPTAETASCARCGAAVDTADLRAHVEQHVAVDDGVEPFVCRHGDFGGRRREAVEQHCLDEHGDASAVVDQTLADVYRLRYRSTLAECFEEVRCCAACEAKPIARPTDHVFSHLEVLKKKFRFTCSFIADRRGRAVSRRRAAAPPCAEGFAIYERLVAHVVHDHECSKSTAPSFVVDNSNELRREFEAEWRRCFETAPPEPADEVVSAAVRRTVTDLVADVCANVGDGLTAHGQDVEADMAGLLFGLSAPLSPEAKLSEASEYVEASEAAAEEIEHVESGADLMQPVMLPEELSPAMEWVGGAETAANGDNDGTDEVGVDRLFAAADVGSASYFSFQRGVDDDVPMDMVEDEEEDRPESTGFETTAPPPRVLVEPLPGLGDAACAAPGGVSSAPFDELGLCLADAANGAATEAWEEDWQRFLLEDQQPWP